jgi:hypothetical protein
MTIGIAESPVGKIKLRYGWAEIMKCGELFLIFIMTFLLCLGIINGDVHKHFHFEESNNEPTVIEPTVTASPGFISVSPQILEDDELLVTSNSSIPVDITVETEEGYYPLTILGLQPGGSFSYKPITFGTITAAATE